MTTTYGERPGIVRAPRCTNCLWDSADGIGADGLCDDCRDMQEDEANYSRREWEHDRYDDERREDAEVQP